MFRTLLTGLSLALTVASGIVTTGIKPQDKVALGQTLTDTYIGTYYTTADIRAYNKTTVKIKDTLIYTDCKGKPPAEKTNLAVKVSYDGFKVNCRFTNNQPSKTAPNRLKTYKPVRPHYEKAYNKGYYKNLTKAYAMGIVTEYDNQVDVGTLQIIEDNRVVEVVKVAGLSYGRYTDVVVKDGVAKSFNYLPIQVDCTNTPQNQIKSSNPNYDISHCL